MATIKIKKPEAPVLQKITVANDLNCNLEQDKQMCSILVNFESLMRYICKLEANPTWDNPTHNLCPVPL